MLYHAKTNPLNCSRSLGSAPSPRPLSPRYTQHGSSLDPLRQLSLPPLLPRLASLLFRSFCNRSVASVPSAPPLLTRSARHGSSPRLASLLFRSLLISALTVFGIASSSTFAGVNDFFGGSIPTPGATGLPSDDTSTMTPSRGIPREGIGPSDYTEDEKRMRKKYRANMNRARQLIAKGDKMMKEGQGRKDDRTFKKGKILKEIGEKQLTELKANSPFGNEETRSGSNNGGGAGAALAK